jgi:hypothetical protein
MLIVFSTANQGWCWGLSKSNIEIDTVFNKKDKNTAVILSIKNAPNTVRSLGFDVVYDPSALTYSNYTKGSIAESFNMFDANKIKDGLLRVGGFVIADDVISAGDSGELIILNFKAVKKGKFKIEIKNLQDDISSWTVERK